MSASKMAVRMIGSIPVATNDNHKYGIVYKSQKTLRQIVSKFIVSNKYHDRKFKTNFVVIESQDNVTYNMRVKNRVPYVIEVTASNELWHEPLQPFKQIVELIPDLRNRNMRFFLYVMWCIVFLRIFHKK